MQYFWKHNLLSLVSFESFDVTILVEQLFKAQNKMKTGQRIPKQNQTDRDFQNKIWTFYSCLFGDLAFKLQRV